MKAMNEENMVNTSLTFKRFKFKPDAWRNETTEGKIYKARRVASNRYDATVTCYEILNDNGAYYFYSDHYLIEVVEHKNKPKESL